MNSEGNGGVHLEFEGSSRSTEMVVTFFILLPISLACVCLSIFGPAGGFGWFLALLTGLGTIAIAAGFIWEKKRGVGINESHLYWWRSRNYSSGVKRWDVEVSQIKTIDVCKGEHGIYLRILKHDGPHLCVPSWYLFNKHTDIVDHLTMSLPEIELLQDGKPMKR